jgi:NADH dehydrogenase [ubiquinone] 1 alpha subcomplex assembly factor 6
MSNGTIRKLIKHSKNYRNISNLHSNSFKYNIELVKSSDFDGYLSGLLFPKSSIRAYYAIKAFNCEIAQIREQSKNNFLTGKIRFQFWRDVLEKIYNNQTLGKIGDNPLMQELAVSIKEHNLTRRYFDRIIEARINDFSDIGFQNISELETYAESTYSSIK